jgi:hypothetical protein
MRLLWLGRRRLAGQPESPYRMFWAMLMTD